MKTLKKYATQYIRQAERGFALATVLIASTVMLIVLVIALQATTGTGGSVIAAQHNIQANDAAKSGLEMAKQCINAAGGVVQWTDEHPLTPATDCSGFPRENASSSLTSEDSLTTTFSVKRPGYTNGLWNIAATGYSKQLNKKNGNVQRAVTNVATGTVGKKMLPEACPTGYALVPGNSYYGTEDFCMMKYEAKNVGGVATATPEGKPWVSISHANAITTADAACPTCHLITGAEWMTAATNALSVPSNWTSGVVGEGAVYGGHSDSTNELLSGVVTSTASALPASSNDADGYYLTGDTAPSTQRRTLTLTNGEVIWDMGGNVYDFTTEWQPNALIGIPGETAYSWKSYNDPALNLSAIDYRSLPVGRLYGEENGVGGVYANGSVTASGPLARGGFYGSGYTHSGPIAMRLGTPASAGGAYGFRVTQRVSAPHMQSFTASTCPKERTLALDARDNGLYWIQKLADNKCWMLTNLAYGGGVSNGGVSSYGDTRTLQNGTSDTSTTYTAPKYYVPPKANPTYASAVPSTSRDDPQQGYMYNWCAAMGGQATAACQNATTPAPVLTTSVCPAGWRLPTSAQFTALNNAVNDGSLTSTSGLDSKWISQYGGYFDGSFSSTYDANGYYWTNEQASATAAWRLAVLGSGSVSLANNGSKNGGRAVRCIIN